MYWILNLFINQIIKIILFEVGDKNFILITGIIFVI